MGNIFKKNIYGDNNNAKALASGITTGLSTSSFYNTPGGYDGSSKDILDLADPMYWMAGGRESAVGNGLSDAGKGIFNAGLSNGNAGLMLVGGIAKGVGGVVNTLFGHSVDKEGQKRLAQYLAQSNALQFNAVNNDLLLNQLSSVNLGGVGLNKRKYKNGVFNHSGSRALQKDILALNRATAKMASAELNAINNTDTKMDLNILANFGTLAAYGGYLLSKGGDIHINDANKGTFTEAAKKAGMSVLLYAAHVLANKDKYSPQLVRRANFARNAAKWNALGGYLFEEGGMMDPTAMQDPQAMIQQLAMQQAMLEQMMKLLLGQESLPDLNQDVPDESLEQSLEQQYEEGEVYEVTEEEYRRLLDEGYKVEVIEK